MLKSNVIGAIILGAAASVALLEFYRMPYYEREEFLSHLKNKTHDLLDDAEGTLDTVKVHFDEIDSIPVNQWVDKLFVVKRLLTNLFGSERRYLL